MNPFLQAKNDKKKHNILLRKISGSNIWKSFFLPSLIAACVMTFSVFMDVLFTAHMDIDLTDVLIL